MSWPWIGIEPMSCGLALLIWRCKPLSYWKPKPKPPHSTLRSSHCWQLRRWLTVRLRQPKAWEGCTLQTSNLIWGQHSFFQFEFHCLALDVLWFSVSFSLFPALSHSISLFSAFIYFSSISFSSPICLSSLPVFSGHYIYLEASSPTQQGDKAQIESGSLAATTSTCMMSLWYHMRGSGTGTLNVYMVKNTGEERLLFNRTGHQGDKYVHWCNLLVQFADIHTVDRALEIRITVSTWREM